MKRRKEMKKKVISIIALSLLSVYAVFAFVPAIFLEELWAYEGFGNGYRKIAAVSENMLDTEYPVLAIVTIAFALVGIVGLSLQLAHKENKAIKLLNFAPAVSLLFLAVMAFMLTEGHFNEVRNIGYTSFDFDFGFYIELLFIIAASVLSILLALKKFKEMPKKSINTEAFELERYKQLLDQGVITPEEFEAKKKQILGL